MKKLFSKMKKKKEEEKFEYSNKEGVGIILYENDHVTIVHDSCRICYNKKVNNTFEDKLKYIGDKVKIGHESILEHSNVIMKLELSKELYPELIELLNYTKYLNIKTIDTKYGIEVLIGGSIRGYKHIIRSIKNPDNKVFKILKETLYELPYCYFTDMINDNIFELHKFYNIDKREYAEMEGEDIIKKKRVLGKIIKRENFDIVGIDDILSIFKASNFPEEGKYDIDDILDLTTISILFKKVSRTASHQLVRHRTGVTQLSQRYVNMKDAEFLSPDRFKDSLDSNKKYKINIGNTESNLTLQQTGDMINSIYPQLVEQGLLKEDARSFLASNIETSLYMTFTIRNFIKFLELRSHKSAQAEIREYALELEEIFKEDQCTSIGDDIYSYLLPNYIRIQLELDTMGTDTIDEIIEEVVEEV